MKAVVGTQYSVFCEQKPEVRSQKSEVRGQK
jgi:hypothetical protein